MKQGKRPVVRPRAPSSASDKSARSKGQSPKARRVTFAEEDEEIPPAGKGAGKAKKEKPWFQKLRERREMKKKGKGRGKN